MTRVIVGLLTAALSSPPVEGPAEPETVETPIPEEPDAAESDAEPEGDAAAPTDDADAQTPAAQGEGEPEGTTLPSVEDPPGESSEPPPQPQPEPKPEPKAEGPEKPPGPEVPLGKDRLGCEHSKSCRQLTITGTVLGSLGLAAVASGIGLLVKPDEVIEDEPAFVTSTHPPGLIATTLGTGVVITSVLMLIAAHRGARQRDLEDADTAWLPRWRRTELRLGQ
jgi:hypothetical protein